MEMDDKFHGKKIKFNQSQFQIEYLSIIICDEDTPIFEMETNHPIDWLRKSNVLFGIWPSETKLSFDLLLLILDSQWYDSFQVTSEFIYWNALIRQNGYEGTPKRIYFFKMIQSKRVFVHCIEITIPQEKTAFHLKLCNLVINLNGSDFISVLLQIMYIIRQIHELCSQSKSVQCIIPKF